MLIKGYGNDDVGYPLFNLDHIAEFRPVGDHKGKRPFERKYACFTIAPELIGHVSGADLADLESCRVTIVPDLTGTKLLVYIWGGMEGDQPKIDQLLFPIIAWKVDGDLLYPITVEGVTEENRGNTRHCYVLGTGLYSFPEDCTCATPEEAQAEAIRGFQRDALAP